MSKVETLDVKKLENGAIVQRVTYRNAADGLRHTEYRTLYTKDIESYKANLIKELEKMPKHRIKLIRNGKERKAVLLNKVVQLIKETI